MIKKEYSNIALVRDLEDAGMKREVAEILVTHQEQNMVAKDEMENLELRLTTKIELAKKDTIIATGAMLVTAVFVLGALQSFLFVIFK